MTAPMILSDAPFTSPTELTLDRLPTAAIRHAQVTMADLPGIFDTGFSTLAQLGPIGPGYAIYTGDPSSSFDIEIGFPTADPIAAEGTTGAVPSTFLTGRVLVISHLGGFDGLGDAWGAFIHAALGAGHLPGARYAEIYVTDPSTVTDPAGLRTDLVLELAG